MAVLAAQDWQPPKDHTMESPNGSNPTNTRQHAATPTTSPPPVHIQQPYPYPVQQQQTPWTPNHSAPPFYPAFYQQYPQQQPAQAQNPYFDQNSQFAQWAYQQMMFNAQQGHQLPQFPASQRGRSGSSTSTQPDYHPTFNPFPSGTPPPGQNFAGPRSAPPADGFHPYRRPNRSQSQDPSQPTSPATDWRSPGPFHDASGSTTSVNSSSSHSTRHRTNSNNSQQPHRPPATNIRPAAAAPSRPHYRTASSSSNSSATRNTPASSSTTAPAAPAPRPVKSSPLSQVTATEKRMSRDDSDLANMMESNPTVSGSRNGLKGRFRRAISFNAANTLREEEEGAEDPITPRGKANQGRPGVLVDNSGDDPAAAGAKKKSRTALFNSKLNASTDNISLSSTMSSASMVIRKLGKMANLTRRNSLAGITSLFKEKKDKEDDANKSKKKKKGGKGAAAEASVSHVTAELDRSEWSAELNGLTPAARLARQHTLKTNAEAAARASMIQESPADGATPATWEKNTTTRKDEANGRVSEVGTRVVVEQDSDSDEDKSEGPSHTQDVSLDGWDDNEDWGEGDDDEDVTVRGVGSLQLDRDDDMEPWAVDLRRSVEKKRTPAKGILKTTAYAAEPPIRTRSNSYDAAPSQPHELGPLARISSTDPDHIDGVHHGPNVVSPAPSTPFLPPLAFQSEPPKDEPPSPHHDKSMFSHSNLSAPALSSLFTPKTPAIAQRSATVPAKRLAFASNLSVYDTFPPSVYDRRSEPATWSRLTPALAQRIKEELNSYKMEEMEVHASSRIHTQFFV